MNLPGAVGPRAGDATFQSGSLGGAIYTGENADTNGFAPGAAVSNSIPAAGASQIRRQRPERVFTGAPKFWKVTNRALAGNVQVWRGSFDGEVYPEGATDDKKTWLQPGEAMQVPLEAGVFFFGNIFDPRLPDALDIIEKTGGFELEAPDFAQATPKGAAVRIVGPPIALPDFVIEPIDGRMRIVGDPVALYELYFNHAKKRGLIHRRRTGRDNAALEAEQIELQSRFEEYQMTDESTIVDQYERPFPRSAVADDEDETTDDDGNELPEMTEAMRERPAGDGDEQNATTSRAPRRRRAAAPVEA